LITIAGGLPALQKVNDSRVFLPPVYPAFHNMTTSNPSFSATKSLENLEFSGLFVLYKGSWTTMLTITGSRCDACKFSAFPILSAACTLCRLFLFFFWRGWEISAQCADLATEMQFQYGLGVNNVVI